MYSGTHFLDQLPVRQQRRFYLALYHAKDKDEILRQWKVPVLIPYLPGDDQSFLVNEIETQMWEFSNPFMCETHQVPDFEVGEHGKCVLLNLERVVLHQPVVRTLLHYQELLRLPTAIALLCHGVVQLETVEYSYQKMMVRKIDHLRVGFKILRWLGSDPDLIYVLRSLLERHLTKLFKDTLLHRLVVGSKRGMYVSVCDEAVRSELCRCLPFVPYEVEPVYLLYINAYDYIIEVNEAAVPVYWELNLSERAQASIDAHFRRRKLRALLD